MNNLGKSNYFRALAFGFLFLSFAVCVAATRDHTVIFSVATLLCKQKCKRVCGVSVFDCARETDRRNCPNAVTPNYL